MRVHEEFLGFVVSDKGIETNPTKAQAISDFPIPRTVKEPRLIILGIIRILQEIYSKLR